MKITKMTFTVALLTLLVGSSAIADGGAELKLTYVDMDEEGNLAVNHNTFNQYDQSFQISLNNMSVLMANDVRLSANLSNISVNNRNLSARLYKRGLFSLSATNKQYRRQYGFSGDRFTRRRSTTLKADITPIKSLKLFGGLAFTGKEGNEMIALSPVRDTIFSSSDYLYGNYHGGLQAYCPFGTVRAVYRRGEFMDDLDFSLDRKSETVDISAFSRIPSYHQVMLSAGFITRYDEIYDRALRIDRDQLWGAMRWNLQKSASFEYRLLSASVEDGVDSVTTDHIVHKLSAGKKFNGYGGLRAGYQLSNAKDDVDELESNGFMVSGWLDYVENLLLKARLFVRNNEVTKGATLIGDEDFTRSAFSAKYALGSWVTLSSKYESRVRKNDDLGSRVDYSSVSSSVDLDLEDLATLSFSYGYYLGEYQNNSDSVDYEFADNIIRAEIKPVPIDKVEFKVGVSYLRGHRDQDTEKLNADFAGTYDFGMNHYLQLRYTIATYDDFMVSQNYYTANIIEVSFIKGLHW
ncbi:MAG: hypothetical protein P1R58_03700 [bacterium]|nr:hypothetical protein [bacterium]